MSQTPKVSIIIAAYQAGASIAYAIQSCLNQTETSFEVIVIDDASPEPMAPIVAEAADGDTRIRCERLAENSGPSGARNRGLDLARGAFVAILDADDTMRPDRLETLLKVAETHKADIVVDNMIAHYVQAAGDHDEPFLNMDTSDEVQVLDLETYMHPRRSSALGRPLGYLKPLIHQSVLNDWEGRYDVSLTNSEDYYLIAELLARKAKMVLMGYAGYVYTIQSGSISHRLRPDQSAAVLRAEKRFQSNHAATMSPAEKRAAAARYKSWRRLHEFETLVDDLKQRAFLRFFAHLFSNPMSLVAHIGRFISTAFRKLAAPRA